MWGEVLSSGNCPVENVQTTDQNKEVSEDYYADLNDDQQLYLSLEESNNGCDHFKNDEITVTDTSSSPADIDKEILAKGSSNKFATTHSAPRDKFGKTDLASPVLLPEDAQFFSDEDADDVGERDYLTDDSVLSDEGAAETEIQYNGSNNRQSDLPALNVVNMLQSSCSNVPQKSLTPKNLRMKSTVDKTSHVNVETAASSHPGDVEINKTVTQPTAESYSAASCSYVADATETRPRSPPVKQNKKRSFAGVKKRRSLWAKSMTIRTLSEKKKEVVAANLTEGNIKTSPVTAAGGNIRTRPFVGTRRRPRRSEYELRARRSTVADKL